MPIVLSADEWARIRRWTETGREDPDVVRRREYVRYLDQASKEMTKAWPNSLEVCICVHDDCIHLMFLFDFQSDIIRKKIIFFRGQVLCIYSLL